MGTGILAVSRTILANICLLSGKFTVSLHGKLFPALVLEIVIIPHDSADGYIMRTGGGAFPAAKMAVQLSEFIQVKNQQGSLFLAEAPAR
jgi:hypothetical protein